MYWLYNLYYLIKKENMKLGNYEDVNRVMHKHLCLMCLLPGTRASGSRWATLASWSSCGRNVEPATPASPDESAPCAEPRPSHAPPSPVAPRPGRQTSKEKESTNLARTKINFKNGRRPCWCLRWASRHEARRVSGC